MVVTSRPFFPARVWVADGSRGLGFRHLADGAQRVSRRDGTLMGRLDGGFPLGRLLRLARFNVSHVPAGPFQGLPIPAGGLLLASFVIARAPLTPLIAMSAMVFVGGLMVSSVPYCNAKKLKKQNINKIKFYGLTGFIFLCFALLREKAFLLVGLMYIASGLVRFDGAQWLLDEEHTVHEKD